MLNPLISRSSLTAVSLCCKFVILGALSGSLWFYTSRGFTTSVQTRVTVTEQPSSPLLIVPTNVNSSAPLSPRYGYLLTNVGNKAIRAFAIQESVSLDAGPPIKGTHFAHLISARMFLKPQETRQEEGGLGSTYQTPPLKIELAVDFVEFADGTKWGPDEGNSADRLDGIRAGGRAAIKQYRDILLREGTGALEEALATSNIQPAEPPRSEEWAAGFKNGVSSVKSRLAKAKAGRGEEGLKHELQKPFDSTEGGEQR
jgi:hypothetical protein